jgi:hypothetical protein
MQNDLDALYNDLDRIHGVWMDMLRAAVDSCKKRRVLISRQDLSCLMDGVSDALIDESAKLVEELQEAGELHVSHLPQNPQKLIAQAYEVLIDHFRIKPVKIERDILNPATLQFTGVL